jgi:hypothetical protein
MGMTVKTVYESAHIAMGAMIDNDPVCDRTTDIDKEDDQAGEDG